MNKINVLVVEDEEDIRDVQVVISAFSSTKLLPVVKNYGRLGAGFVFPDEEDDKKETENKDQETS